MPSHIKSTLDHDKWKKKFALVFNREKIINFTNENPGQSLMINPSDIKNLSFEP